MSPVVPAREPLQPPVKLSPAGWSAGTGWQRLAPVPLQTVCLRHCPPGLSGAALDTHNLEMARRINTSGRAYLTPAVVKGTQVLRGSIGAEATEREDVEQVWARIQEAAR